MLTELSLSRDRNSVVHIPTAENALSASTDVGGNSQQVRVHCLQLFLVSSLFYVYFIFCAVS